MKGRSHTACCYLLEASQRHCSDGGAGSEKSKIHRAGPGTGMGFRFSDGTRKSLSKTRVQVLSRGPGMSKNEGRANRFMLGARA